jgi:hypothetical protein
MFKYCSNVESIFEQKFFDEWLLSLPIFFLGFKTTYVYYDWFIDVYAYSRWYKSVNSIYLAMTWLAIYLVYNTRQMISSIKAN